MQARVFACALCSTHTHDIQTDSYMLISWPRPPRKTPQTHCQQRQAFAPPAPDRQTARPSACLAACQLPLHVPCQLQQAPLLLGSTSPHQLLCQGLQLQLLLVAVAVQVAHHRLEVAAAVALPVLLVAGALLLGCWPTHQLAAAAGAALLLPSSSPHRQVGVEVQVLTSPSPLLRQPRVVQAVAGVAAAAAVAVVLVARLLLPVPFESCAKRRCNTALVRVETRTKMVNTAS